MAASIVHVLAAERADASSAGMEAWGQEASQKAVALVRRKYGVDLSSHRSRDVEHMPLNDFDLIIAMEPRFAKRLVKEFGVPLHKLLTWDIDDPAIANTDGAYESCLVQLEALIPQLLETMLLE